MGPCQEILFRSSGISMRILLPQNMIKLLIYDFVINVMMIENRSTVLAPWLALVESSAHCSSAAKKTLRVIEYDKHMQSSKLWVIFAMIFLHSPCFIFVEERTRFSIPNHGCAALTIASWGDDRRTCFIWQYGSIWHLKCRWLPRKAARPLSLDAMTPFSQSWQNGISNWWWVEWWYRWNFHLQFWILKRLELKAPCSVEAGSWFSCVYLRHSHRHRPDMFWPCSLHQGGPFGHVHLSWSTLHAGYAFKII